MLDYNQTIDFIQKAQNGDEKSKEILITQNSPLIKSVIKHYKNKGIDYDDLYQLGCLGFLKAINNFDISYNVKFSTYAVPMVAGEVKRFLRDDGSIKISRSIKSQYIQINKYINELKQKDCAYEICIEDIAKKFNIDENEVVFTLDSGKALLSLDERQDEENSKSKTLLESLGEEDKTDLMINNIALKTILKELNSRDKKLLLLRYFQDKTQSEIAKELGVSQVQVSRLEYKILEKIKIKLKA